MEEWPSRRNEVPNDETEGRVEIDALSRGGLLKEGDVPGSDLFDDGMDAHGKVVQPGSTTTSGGGMYLDDQGPNDLVHRNVAEELSARMDGLEIVDDPKEEARASKADRGIYQGNDAAAVWLRKHDEEYVTAKKRAKKKAR